MLSQQLLDILRCPRDLGDLDYRPEENKLICKKCGTSYDIVDDIPIMIADDDDSSNTE